MSEEPKPLLQQIPVVRDEDGHFYHPDLRRFWEVEMEGAERCTPAQWEALCERAGITTRLVWLSSEPMDHPAYVAYFDNGGGAKDWDPSPPRGYWLIEIGDSEDGPYAVWATPIAAPTGDDTDMPRNV